MNLAQINAFRASQGLAPIAAKKDSKLSQKRQRDNQIARAAANKEIMDKRSKKK